MFRFEGLEIYKKSREFTNIVYKLTSTWPKSEMFGLCDQMRRASVSISLNIAEGTSRTNKDFGHFLDMANGSVYECAAIAGIAKDNGYLTATTYQEVYKNCEELSKMIGAFKKTVLAG